MVKSRLFVPPLGFTDQYHPNVSTGQRNLNSGALIPVRQRASRGRSDLS
jgi:hypothetical protein